MFKNYTMNQLFLPIDLEVSLQDNDVAFHIHHLVESIPNEAFQPFKKNNGCPAYHLSMILKIILCGYTQFTFTGRKIEANANKFSFVWRRSVERYNRVLLKNKMN